MISADPRHLPPDARTLAWAATRLGSRTASVVRRLGGGLDAATHLVTTDDGREAVLRRGTGEWAAWRDGVFRRECAILGRIQAAGLPVARLLAADLDARETDAPAMLLSRLPGALTVPAQPSGRWVREMGAAMAAIHRLPAPAAGWPWSDQVERLTRRLADADPGDWAPLLARGVPVSGTVFVHGDLWAGNVLFDRDRVTGIVDWGDAGAGYAGMEVGHARADLVICTGSEAVADGVVDAYEAVAGPLADRAWWEAAGYLPFPEDPAEWLPGWVETGLSLDEHTVRRRRDEGLQAALQRLSATDP